MIATGGPNGATILISPLADLSAGLFLLEIATDEHSYLLRKNLRAQGPPGSLVSAQSRQFARARGRHQKGFPQPRALVWQRTSGIQEWVRPAQNPRSRAAPRLGFRPRNRAAPRLGFRPRNEPGAQRIQIHVPRRGNQILIIHRAGGKPGAMTRAIRAMRIRI